MFPVKPWCRAGTSSYKLTLVCGHTFSVETSHHPGVPWVNCEACGRMVDVAGVRRL